jgi:hypothetical protein
MEFDFSELEQLHKDTFKEVINVVVDHYDNWVKDESIKLKSLTQIKKETEQLTNLFGKNNVNSN